jgi:hypothetical protein
MDTSTVVFLIEGLEVEKDIKLRIRSLSSFLLTASITQNRLIKYSRVCYTVRARECYIDSAVIKHYNIW